MVKKMGTVDSNLQNIDKQNKEILGYVNKVNVYFKFWQIYNYFISED